MRFHEYLCFLMKLNFLKTKSDQRGCFDKMWQLLINWVTYRFFDTIFGLNVGQQESDQFSRFTTHNDGT